MAKDEVQRNKLLKDTAYKAVGMRFDLEDAKSMGFNPDKVKTSEVIEFVRKTLKLPERSRGSGKTKLMKAIASQLTVEDLQKLAKQKGIQIEDL